MVHLDQTSEALANIDAIKFFGYGEHYSNNIRPDVYGDFIAEVDFDPTIHDPSLINHLSVWQEVVEKPQVVERHPYLPLELSIIVHQPSGSKLDEELHIGENRRLLARQIGQAIDLSIPDISDRSGLYLVGNMANEAKLNDAEIVETSGEELDDEEQIADLCVSGLNIIISDFIKLKLNNNESDQSVVAVKANVPQDLHLETSNVILRSGMSLGEIDTRDTLSLDNINQLLKSAHINKTSQLREKGFSVASITMLPTMDKSAFKKAIDPILATAIEDAETQALTV